MAHRKVVLGAMAGTVGALASWLATAFVPLDQRAAQDRLERGQLAHLRLWKWELQGLADQTGLTLTVHHFSNGTR